MTISLTIWQFHNSQFNIMCRYKFTTPHSFLMSFDLSGKFNMNLVMEVDRVNDK